MNYTNVLSDLCTSEAGYRLFGFIGYIMNFLQIIVPIIIIIMGTIDLVKALVAQSPEDMKKSQNMFIKRLIVGVIIFFIPMLVNFIINMVNGTDDSGNVCLSSFSNPKQAMNKADIIKEQKENGNITTNNENCLRTIQMGNNTECITQDLQNQITEQ